MNPGRYTSTPDGFAVSRMIAPAVLRPGVEVRRELFRGSRQVTAGPVVNDCSVTPSAPTAEKSYELIE
jgi:hypothetical protein